MAYRYLTPAAAASIPTSHRYEERWLRENLAYKIKKSLLEHMGYSEEQAQDDTGVPQQLLNAIYSVLDQEIKRNNAFKRA